MAANTRMRILRDLLKIQRLSLGSPKIFNFWGEEEVRQAKLVCEFLLASHFRRGPPMMSKTVLDLLHSLGVEDDMIMFDNFGG